MEHDPAGLKERVGSFFGADEGQVENDLERFRGLVEARGLPTDEWRGRIESGTVVDDDRS